MPIITGLFGTYVLVFAAEILRWKRKVQIAATLLCSRYMHIVDRSFYSFRSHYVYGNEAFKKMLSRCDRDSLFLSYSGLNSRFGCRLMWCL